ncbi:Endonuclease III [uncultured archaeon]|nr:Endonuclease III [uncultured archaeon]
MKPTRKQLMWVYKKLHSAYGPRNWWPADTDFEVIVGAILTQQAQWSNVEKAIANLKDHGLLDPRRLAEAEAAFVEKLVRPAGFYKVKSRRIIDMARSYERIRGAYSMPIPAAREELLSMDGIGPETCDSILLYAGNVPTFVIDAYTKRMAERYGLAEDETIRYHELKQRFEEKLPRNERLFNEYHALIVELGKRHCKVRPECDSCPLGKRCKKRVKSKTKKPALEQKAKPRKRR